MDTRTRLVLPVAMLLALAPACANEEQKPAAGGQGQQEACDMSERTTESGLTIQDVTCGEGAEAKAGSGISVHYVGTLEDGTQFDSSRDRNEPFPLTLGVGMVIPGWDEGLQGMREGGVRKLTIPPDLAYGEAGAPPSIPPNATLLFEVELLEVTKPAP